MKTTIGVYGDHETAVEAVVKLRDAGYPVSHITVMGLLETEQMDSKKHLMEVNPIKPIGLGIGTVLGTTIGVLTGIGIFAIPGVGFLYGAGALAGAIAGFDFGLIGGGVATVLDTVGVKDNISKKYHDALVAGKFLVIAHGNEAEVNKARAILVEHGKHEEIDSH